MFTVENFYTFKTSTASAGIAPEPEKAEVTEAIIPVAAAETPVNAPSPAPVSVTSVPNTFDSVMAYIIVGIIAGIVCVKNYLRKRISV
jgi:hypothetical protein